DMVATINLWQYAFSTAVTMRCGEDISTGSHSFLESRHRDDMRVEGRSLAANRSKPGHANRVRVSAARRTLPRSPYLGSRDFHRVPILDRDCHPHLSTARPLQWRLSLRRGEPVLAFAMEWLRWPAPGRVRPV